MCMVFLLKHHLLMVCDFTFPACIAKHLQTSQCVIGNVVQILKGNINNLHLDGNSLTFYTSIQLLLFAIHTGI